MMKYQWAVIGAGPAGIAVIGNLIDAGIEPKSILWIDPEFQVGDFGTRWQHVSSNTSVKLFRDFYNACYTFNYQNAPSFDIDIKDPTETCYLKLAAEPLRWITKQLQQKVTNITDFVSKLSQSDKLWKIETENNQSLFVENVVLATGAEPSSLPIDMDSEEIDLETALNKAELKKAIQHKRRIAVFGSSHSAIIIVRDLLELGVEQIDNYYREPLRYAVFFDDWTLYDNTGLKGKTAQWSKENLHGRLPIGLSRYLSTEENINTNRKNTDAVIFATGFKRRNLVVEGLVENFSYNQHCGIIAPGLFGVGIGFPELYIDRYNNQELSVGLWKFMQYIKRVMPVWLKYGI